MRPQKPSLSRRPRGLLESVSRHVQGIYVLPYAYIQKHIHVYRYIHTYIHTYMHKLHMYIHTLHICTIYIYIHTNTCTCTYIYIHRQMHSSTPQLPFQRPQIPSNRDHKVFNRGTLGGAGCCEPQRSALQNPQGIWARCRRWNKATAPCQSSWFDTREFLGKA